MGLEMVMNYKEDKTQLKRLWSWRNW